MLSPTKIQVYEIRPYVYEFFRAIEPFFEIIVYSCLHHQILEQIVDHFTNRLRAGEHPAIADYQAQHPEFKDEILEEEFEKLDDKFKPDEESFYATKQVFEAYITDKSFREIIDSGKFNELHVHPSGNYFIKLPEELRSKIPAYIKKNIDLERFIDA